MRHPCNLYLKNKHLTMLVSKHMQMSLKRQLRNSVCIPLEAYTLLWRSTLAIVYTPSIVCYSVSWLLRQKLQLKLNHSIFNHTISLGPTWATTSTSVPNPGVLPLTFSPTATSSSGEGPADPTQAEDVRHSQPCP